MKKTKRRARKTVYAKRTIPDYYYHRVSAIQKRRNRKRAERMVVGIKILCVVLLAASVLGGLWLGGRWVLGYVRNDPVFTVSKVDVRNNWKLPAKILVRKSGAFGKNIFDVDLLRVRERIESIVSVRRAVINRRLPATVEIIVFEREPFACVKGKRMFVIDQDGVIISGPHRECPDARLPVITGIDPAHARPGESLATVEMKEILTALVSCFSSRVSSSITVTDVAVSAREGVVFNLKSGERIVLGHGDFEKKLSRLELIYDDIMKKHLSTSLIDLRFNDVVVKLAGE